MPTADLLVQLRRRITDVRAAYKAMDVTVTDPEAGTAFAEITHGHLIVTVSGGTASSIDINLTDTRYDTIEKLHQHLSRLFGYVASLAEDANGGHISIDLESFGPVVVKGYGVALRHHRFADNELIDILESAVRRHNATMLLGDLPAAEEELVLTLARADVARVQAYDATKRKGLDTEVGSLLQLADSLEGTYRDDVQRNKRALQVPHEAIPNRMGVGDVVQGNSYRRSLRTGAQAQIASAQPPTIPVFIEEDVRDAEDENVRVLWERNHDTHFYGYELWMDTIPEVQRDGSEPFTERAPSNGAPRPANRQTTSRLVYRAFGANSTNWAAFATLVAQLGQQMNGVTVGQLEPETTYYFRLFVISLNREVAGSEIAQRTTKPLRARLRYTTPIAPTAGVAGTTVTLTFDSTKGPITSAHRVRIGDGAEQVPTVISDYVATVVTQPYRQKGWKNVTVFSPTRLFDVRKNAFEVR